jgi:hypothetical protein
MLLPSSGSKKKEPTYASEWKAKASHSQKTWIEVSSSASHVVHVRLQLSPIKCRCLFRVLGPVRRPVTTLDYVLLNNRNLVLRVGLGPKIIFGACLWLLIRFLHITICWLSIQHWIFFLMFSLEPPKAGSSSTEWRTVLSLASLSAILFPHTPECPGTQNNPTECWMEMSFIAFWHCYTNGNVVLMAWRALKAAWLSEQILPYVSDLAVIISVSFCSSLSDGWSGSYWMFWFNPFVIVLNAPMITGTIFVLTAHILLTLICRSLYLLSFSVSFVLMFESSGMTV